MKMTKLMAALVVVTIMMTSVVFGATTATTTTTYNVDALTGVATFDVRTDVTGADNAQKLTYVLYNGTTPDEESILYIDQYDGDSTYSFIVNDIPAGKFIGSTVIANDDVTDEDVTPKPVGDFFKLTKGTMTGVESVTFVAGEEVYDFDKNGVVYLPVNVDVEATFFTKPGTKLDTVKQGAVSLETNNGNKVQLNTDYDVNETVVLDATVKTEDEGKLVSVDNSPIIDVEGRSVTFIISTSNLTRDEIAKVGLNVVITGECPATLEDMRPHTTMSDGVEAFGIMITDEAGDRNLVGDNTYTTSISLDGVKLYPVDGGYYVVTPSAE